MSKFNDQFKLHQLDNSSLLSGTVAAIAGLNPVTSAIYAGVDKSLSTAAQARLIKYVESLDKRISELELSIPENMQPELSELLEIILIDVKKPQNAKKDPYYVDTTVNLLLRAKEDQHDWSEESYLLFVIGQLPLVALQRLAVYSYSGIDEGKTELALSTVGALESYGLLHRRISFNMDRQPSRAIEQSLTLTSLGSALNKLTHPNDDKNPGKYYQ